MMRVFYRADGSAEIGTGHLLRGILIGRELRRGWGAELASARAPIPGRSGAWERRASATHWLPVDLPAEDEVDAVCAARASCGAEVAAVDLLDTGTAPDLCARLRSGGVPVVTFDDLGEGRLSASAIINFLVRDPSPETVRARGVALHEGPEYATLVPEYVGANAITHPIADVARHLMVSLGGGDAAGLTLKVLRALRHSRVPLDVTVVVGSAYPHREASMPWLPLLPRRSRCVRMSLR